MAAKRRSRDERPARGAAERRAEGIGIVRTTPLLRSVAQWVGYVDDASSRCPPDGLAVVHVPERAHERPEIHLHPTRDASPAEWAWAVAHCLVHIGLGHVDERQWHDRPLDAAAHVAACLTVDRLLTSLGSARPPVPIPPSAPTGDDDTMAERLRRDGIPADLVGLGPAGARPADFRPATARTVGMRAVSFEEIFAEGLADAVVSALEVAATGWDADTARRHLRTPWRAALQWFVTEYPLLGALAAGLEVVEDAAVCRSLDIAVAAVSAATAELYLNPEVTMTRAERRFVVAHELLHAGLRHDTRGGGRHALLWNVACDFSINGWLVAMGVGQLPDGALYDPELADLAAEAIYERIANDLRRFRRVLTFGGTNRPDILPGVGDRQGATDLDTWYRSALTHGLELQRATGRGLLPAGLVEEIRALAQPPVPWDVQLADWFDERLPAAEARRTYARASRRQSATPDIPRPAVRVPDEVARRRTFGVVLDTSGSMDRVLLARALGAIASFAASRDVALVRVVFCDAVAYDAGYLTPDAVAGRVQVRGRGGTALQPGVDLLERATDFPADGPILVITDAQCDHVRIRRDHAYLVPAGARLPFTPFGPVFRMTGEG